MSTVISNAYDTLVAEVSAVFPDHVELINPYFPEENDDLTYDAAYGIAFIDGENTQREFGCNYTVRRNFTVTLTRKIFKGDLSRNTSSVQERRDAEKQLFEDLHLLIKSVENSVTLNAGSGNSIGWCLYRADSGLEFIKTDAFNLIMVRAIFEIEYFESLQN